ncbi:MAG: hypothetical protein JWO75_485 [Actinomycetia bacterium]|nr:hypothetical protein [Actinomycetes bacterium]
MSTPERPAPGGFLAPAPDEAPVTVRPEQGIPGVAFLAPDWPDDDGEES